MPHELWDFLVWLVTTGTVSRPLWLPSTHHSSSFRWFSPWPLVTSSHSILWWILKGDSLFPEFSFCVAFFSLVPCPANSSHVVLHRFSVPSRQLIVSARLLLDSFLLAWWPGSSLRAASWGNYRAYLICFPCLKDHCPSLPDLVSGKTVFHIVGLILFPFGYLRQEVKSDFSYSIHLSWKWKSLLISLELKAAHCLSHMPLQMPCVSRLSDVI